MLSADAASLTGKWSLDGVPSPSGTAAMSASIVDLPDGRCRLSLPDDLRPAVGGVEIVLNSKGGGVYSALAPTGSKVTLTATSPAHARLEIAGESPLSRFEVLLTRVGH